MPTPPILLDKESYLLGEAEHRPWWVQRVAHERWGLGHVVDWERFPRWFFALVLAGRCRDRVGGREWDLVPGTVLLLRPGEGHRVELESPLELLLAVMDGPRLAAEGQRFLGRGPGPVACPEAGAVEGVLRGMLAAARAGGPHREAIVEGFLEILLRTVHTSRLRGPRPPEGALATFARCRDHADRHFAELGSAGELAAACHVDRAWLSRLFQRHERCGPGAYLRRRKLQQAAELLSTTDAAVAAVAAEVGYGDPFTFSKAFRRAYGAPPSRWRDAR